MSKRPFYSKVPLLLATSLLTIAPLLPSPAWAAATAQAQPTAQSLPILTVTPADGTTVVRPDATIQFVLDPSAQGFKQFEQQYQQGKYTITLNDQQVQGTLDTTTNTITLTNPTLDRYTAYTVLLEDTSSTSPGNGNGKGKGGGKKSGSTSTSYWFSFTTGSALHEATHLTAAVEQPSVLVTAGGKLDVKVTDDYGLPANNATVQATGSSANFSAPVLNLTSTGNGTGVINLTDHVKESVNLTVTSIDNEYSDTVDTQTATDSEQFLSGAPDHLSINAGSPLTVGQGEQVTGTIYDVFNNMVEDSTIVTAATTGGLLAPQNENTSNGTYAFTFTAPTKVQDVVLTAQSGAANGQVTVHLQPDQPADVTLTPDSTTVKAGDADNVQLLVTDQYGNPIPNTTFNVTGTGSSQVPNTVTTDDTGHATIAFNDKKAETVTVTATGANGVQGTAQITVQAGDPANVTLTPDTATVKAGDTDNVQLLVTDQYGNPVPNTSFDVTGTGSSQVAAKVTTDNAGHATIPVSDKTAELVTITATSANGIQGTTQIIVQAGDPANVTLTPDTATVKAGDTDNVQLLVTDQYGNLVPNATFALKGTGSSQVPSIVTTDSNGHAAIPVSDLKAEGVTVIATAADGIQGTAQLTVQAGDPADLTLTPNSQTMNAGGTDNVQVVLTDQNGNPIPNETLTVTGTGNSQIPSTITTDSTGHATIPMTDKTAEAVTITAATADGLQGTAQITVQAGAPASLNLTPDNATVQTGTTDNVQVLLFDQYGNPVPNTQLTVTGTGSSQVPSTVTTDSTGHATIPVSDNTAETVTITTLTQDGVQGSTQITLQSQGTGQQTGGSGTETGTETLTLTPDTPTVQAGNTDNVQVLLVDQNGNPISNTQLTVTGSGSSQAPTTVTTDSTGHATIPISDKKAETITITAMTSDGTQASASINVLAGNPAQVSVQDDQTTITSDGQVTANATVTVVDAYGNPVPNAALTLASTNNAQFPTTLTTNANGQASFSVTDTTAESIIITISTSNNVTTTLTLQSQNSTPPESDTNLIPTMTSDTAPLGIASASSEYSTGKAYYAFTKQTGAWTASTNNGWLQYDFQEPAVVQGYTITPPDTSQAPQSWTFQAWDGSTWVTLDTESGITNWTGLTAKSFAITNTNAYTKYRINVSMDNGYSNLSITNVTMVGYYAIPFTPSGFTDVKNGDSQVTLSWQTGNGITGFNVYQDGIKVNSAPITSTSYTITGLKNGTTYSYTVSALNGSGESQQTAPILAMPFATKLLPAMTSDTAPFGGASASSEISTTVKAYYAFDNNTSTGWTSNTDNGWLQYDFQEPTVVQEYTITPPTINEAPQAWTFQGWDGSSWVDLDTRSNITNWTTGTNYFTFTNTTAYTMYRINVQVDNSAANLGITEMTMEGYYVTPFAPSGLTDVKNGDSQVKLSWQSGNGITGFNVYQDGMKVNSTLITSTSYTVTGLTNNQQYHFTVSAINGAGESSQTAPILAMPFVTNLIPVMTSDTAPLGVASASSESSTTVKAYYAFDNNSGTGWTANTNNGWLEYDFQGPTVVQEYAITSATPTQTPQSWTFQGWDGSQWVTLDTQSNITNWANGTNYYTFTNTTAYTKYRLNVSVDNGGADLNISSLVFAGSQS